MQRPRVKTNIQHTWSGFMMTWGWRAEARVEKDPVRLRESGGL